jgi:AcrR family transcriptional regulator
MAAATVRSLRARRSADEVEQLILDAARGLFASQGYAGTSTREIAARAGVHEPMLYRRYGSKAGLFRAAVLVPFNEVVSSYLRTWEAQADEPASLRDLVCAFVEPLYSLLREHSELAIALVQAREIVAGDDGASWPSELGELLGRLVPQLEIERERRSLRVDPATTNIVVLGMIVGLALLDPVLPTSAVGASPELVSEEMVELILHGVSPVAEPAPEHAAPALPAPPVESVTAQVVLDLHERVVAAERRAARAELELEQLRAKG